MYPSQLFPISHQIQSLAEALYEEMYQLEMCGLLPGPLPSKEELVEEIYSRLVPVSRGIIEKEREEFKCWLRSQSDSPS